MHIDDIGAGKKHYKLIYFSPAQTIFTLFLYISAELYDNQNRGDIMIVAIARYSL